MDQGNPSGIGKATASDGPGPAMIAGTGQSPDLPRSSADGPDGPTLLTRTIPTPTSRAFSEAMLGRRFEREQADPILAVEDGRPGMFVTSSPYGPFGGDLLTVDPVEPFRQRPDAVRWQPPHEPEPVRVEGRSSRKRHADAA